jgi:predicted DNA-binding protein
MDHAINSLKEFLEAERDDVVEQWRSGEYKKLSDCPSYYAAKAIVDAIHVMEKYYYGEKKTMTIRDWIMW